MKNPLYFGLGSEIKLIEIAKFSSYNAVNRA